MRQDQLRQTLKRESMKLEVTKTKELTVAQVILQILTLLRVLWLCEICRYTVSLLEIQIYMRNFY